MTPLLRDMRAVSLLLTATLTILSNMLISPALPGIEAAFSGTPNVELMTRMLVTAPSLMVALVAPFAGALADRFGRRRQLLAGVLLFAVAGSAGLWLPSLTSILASRFVLGVAVALVMTAQTALIGDYYAGDRRARFMGLQIASTNLSGLVFVLVSGWFAGISAFLPFAIYAVALLYVPVILSAIREVDANTAGRAVAAAPGEPGWPMTLGAAVLLATASLVGFYLVPTQMPFYLVGIGHPEPSAIAALQAAVTLAGGLISLTYGRIRARLGRAVTPAIGFALFATGFAALSLTDGLVGALGSSLLIGAATGLLFPMFLSIAIDVAPSSRRGLASGATTTAIFLGQFLSPLVSQPLIAAVGFGPTFAVAGAAFALMGGVALVVFRGPRTCRASSGAN